MLVGRPHHDPRLERRLVKLLNRVDDLMSNVIRVYTFHSHGSAGVYPFSPTIATGFSQPPALELRLKQGIPRSKELHRVIVAVVRQLICAKVLVQQDAGVVMRQMACVVDYEQRMP